MRKAMTGPDKFISPNVVAFNPTKRPTDGPPDPWQNWATLGFKGADDWFRDTVKSGLPSSMGRQYMGY